MPRAARQMLTGMTKRNLIKTRLISGFHLAVRSSLFWDATQRIGKVSTYVSVRNTFPVFKSKTVFCLTHGDGPDRMSRNFGKCQSTDKIHPRTNHEDPEWEQSYRSTLSLSLALDVGEWSMTRPGRFTSGKKAWYQLYRGECGGTVVKVLCYWVRWDRGGTVVKVLCY